MRAVGSLLAASLLVLSGASSASAAVNAPSLGGEDPSEIVPGRKAGRDVAGSVKARSASIATMAVCTLGVSLRHSAKSE